MESEDKKFRKMFKSIKEVFLSLSKNDSPEEILDNITTVLVRELDYFSSAVHMVEGDHLVVKSYSMSPLEIKKIEKFTGLSIKDYQIPLFEESQFYKLIDSKKTMVTNDISQTIKSHLPNFNDRMIKVLVKFLGIKNGMAAPLMVDGKVMGIIAVASRRRLEDEDQKILEEFSSMAAIAIEKSLLFEVLQKIQKQPLYNHELFENTSAKGDLLAGISHELKTPLAIANTSIDLAIYDIKEESALELLNNAKESLSRQNEFINKLLESLPSILKNQ